MHDTAVFSCPQLKVHVWFLIGRQESAMEWKSEVGLMEFVP